jgi:hypothetical protein
MRRIAILLAAAALPMQAIAQAPRCIPQEQAAALVTFALPTLVTGLADRCRAELPVSSYLVANAGALADRYRPDADAAWPTARSAIGGLFSQFLGQPMPPEMNSDLIRQLAEPLLGKFLAKQISTEDCAAADIAVTNIAPLSGRAVGRLVTLGVTMADKKDKGLAGVLHICRPAAKRA